MSDTPNLSLPYLASGQAQKHVTVNEALRMLDALVQISVKSRALPAPPASPAAGDCYLVPAGATGIWTGQQGKLAAFQDGAWALFPPVAGWLIWVSDEELLLVFHANAWRNALTLPQTLPRLGLNATPDATNRLAVSAAATLLNHEGAGHQLKVNKANAAATASLLFQQGFSGRAEMGIAGDDDFRLKVSADGATWREGLVIDRASGAVSFPASLYPEGALFNLMADGGRFAGSPGPTGLLAPAFALPPWLLGSNGAVLAQHGKFHRNSATYGGTAAAIDADTQQLVDGLLAAAFRRNAPEFHVARITAGAATASLIVFPDNVTRYLAFQNDALLRPVGTTFSYYVKVKTGDLGIPKPPAASLWLDGVARNGPFVVPADNGWHHVLAIETGPFNQHDRAGNDSICGYMRSGGQILLALPAAVPGRVQLPPNVGMVASFRTW